MPYELAREEIVQRLEINFLTIENWIDDKLAQGLTKQEIVLLFVESGLAEIMQQFLLGQKQIVARLDTKQYLAYRDIFVKMLQDWGLDKPHYIEAVKTCPIRFFHDFYISHAGPDEIQIHLGQYYRVTLLSEGKLDKQWFDAYVTSAIAHELGHKLEFAAGKKQNNELFAESIAKLFLDYCGIKKDVKKIHEIRAERLAKMKSNPDDVGDCIIKMYLASDRRSELALYLYFTGAAYKVSPKLFDMLMPLEQVKAHLQ